MERIESNCLTPDVNVAPLYPLLFLYCYHILSTILHHLLPALRSKLLCCRKHRLREYDEGEWIEPILPPGKKKSSGGAEKNVPASKASRAAASIRSDKVSDGTVAKEGRLPVDGVEGQPVGASLFMDKVEQASQQWPRTTKVRWADLCDDAEEFHALSYGNSVKKKNRYDIVEEKKEEIEDAMEWYTHHGQKNKNRYHDIAEEKKEEESEYAMENYVFDIDERGYYGNVMHKRFDDIVEEKKEESDEDVVLENYGYEKKDRFDDIVEEKKEENEDVPERSYGFKYEQDVTPESPVSVVAVSLLDERRGAILDYVEAWRCKNEYGNLDRYSRYII